VTLQCLANDYGSRRSARRCQVVASGSGDVCRTEVAGSNPVWSLKKTSRAMVAHQILNLTQLVPHKNEHQWELRDEDLSTGCSGGRWGHARSGLLALLASADLANLSDDWRARDCFVRAERSAISATP
jgi:hypothetical protein